MISHMTSHSTFNVASCVYLTGIVEDILVVPVNISYDKILEKNFVRHELMVRGACLIM